MASFMGLCLIGCNDDYSKDNGLLPNVVGRYLTISTGTLRISSSLAQTASVDVTSENVSWQIAGNQPDWVTSITPKESEGSATINVTVNENPNADTARVCIMQLVSKMPDYPYTSNLQITQEKAAPYIDIDRTSIMFDGKASTAEVVVRSNFNWTYAASANTWLTITKESGKLIVSASENTTDDSREATINLVADNVSKKVTVVQKPANITASVENLTFSNIAETQKIIIRSETEWSASTAYSWIMLAPEKGSVGDSELAISVTNNNENTERVGFVYISQGQNSKIELVITQKSSYMSVSPMELTFDAESQSKILHIDSNMKWKVVTSDSWISADCSTGTGTKDILVSVLANPEETDRTGYVTVCNEDGAQLQKVYVRQQGSLPNFSYKAKASATTISVTPASAYSWNASVIKGDGWMSISPISGNFDTQLIISLSENKSGKSRSGQIDMKFNGGSTSHVYVEQDGKYISASVDKVEFFAKGGTSNQITLSTDGVPVYTKSSDWITINKIGNTAFTVSVSENPSMDTRTGKVTIALDGIADSPSVTLSITQAGQNATFSFEDYDDDSDLLKTWQQVINISSNGSASFVIEDYDADKNLINE